VTQLDSEGYVDPGAASYVTDKAIKATATPVLTTGDDIELKNMAGDLATFGKHGDFPRHYTIALEIGAPDAYLEQLCCGGVLFNSTIPPLATPTGLAVEARAVGGTLPKGIYGYRASAFNAFGETEAEAEVTGNVTGAGETPTGSCFLSNVIPGEGALGVRVYGRTIGIEQYLGTYRLIGKPKLTKAVTAKSKPTSLEVEPLKQPIPAGTRFTVEGDTNSPKVVFTASAYASMNATQIQVTTDPEEVTLEIKAGELVVGFLDDGTIEPEGHVPQKNSTEGPGPGTGYQAPKLGAVPSRAKQGVSLECFGEAILDGAQALDLPYYWWVFPRVTAMHVMPREFANAPNLLTMEGLGFSNPNWGKGPTLDWPFDSSKVFQRTRCGRQVVPKPSLENQPAV
jgi:hypothetical protein